MVRYILIVFIFITTPAVALDFQCTAVDGRILYITKSNGGLNVDWRDPARSTSGTYLLPYGVPINRLTGQQITNDWSCRGQECQIFYERADSTIYGARLTYGAYFYFTSDRAIASAHNNNFSIGRTFSYEMPLHGIQENEVFQLEIRTEFEDRAQPDPVASDYLEEKAFLIVDSDPVEYDTFAGRETRYFCNRF